MRRTDGGSERGAHQLFDFMRLVEVREVVRGRPSHHPWKRQPIVALLNSKNIRTPIYTPSVTQLVV
ncbi:MAG: hypothetical protein ACK5YB_07030, partial [Burkholderiales bacterium]